MGRSNGSLQNGNNTKILGDTNSLLLKGLTTYGYGDGTTGDDASGRIMPVDSSLLSFSGWGAATILVQYAVAPWKACGFIFFFLLCVEEG